MGGVGGSCIPGEGNPRRPGGLRHGRDGGGGTWCTHSCLRSWWCARCSPRRNFRRIGTTRRRSWLCRSCRPNAKRRIRTRIGSWLRSEEHTSELQSLMRISYAVFCLKKKKTTTEKHKHTEECKKTET